MNKLRDLNYNINIINLTKATIKWIITPKDPSFILAY